MNNKKRILLIIFVFIMLTTFHSKEVVLPERIKGFFLIKDVVFQNYSLLSNKQINNKISQIYDRNIFLLSLQDIKKLFNDEYFVKEVHVKKIFPNTIKITITNDEPIAKIYFKKDSFIITESNKLVPDVNFNYSKALPIVNGIGANKKFISFYNFLIENNFPVEKIIQYNYFKIGRWDLYLDDLRIIKLPSNDYEKIVNNINIILSDIRFQNKHVLDFRVKNKIIID